MSSAPYTHHRAAALALLNQCPNLNRKAAGFLGHACVDPSLSRDQHKYLAGLLARNGLPELAAGGDA